MELLLKNGLEARGSPHAASPLSPRDVSPIYSELRHTCLPMSITGRSIAVAGKPFCYSLATGYDGRMKVMHDIQKREGGFFFICENDEGGILDDIARARIRAEIPALADLNISPSPAGDRAPGEGLAPNQATISSPDGAILINLRRHLAYPID